MKSSFSAGLLLVGCAGLGLYIMNKKINQWQPPEKADRFMADIRKAEAEQGLPHNLLARLLYQESRYRDDIITGATVSSAGAKGIAQIVPRWHPNVNPLDPQASIHYAADYLRSLYNQFGTWSLALAAYNWGPGNVKRNEVADWPTETKNYVTQIGADVWLA